MGKILECPGEAGEAGSSSPSRAEFYMDVRAGRISFVQHGSPVFYMRRIWMRRIWRGSVGWMQSVRGAGCFLGIGGRTEISV
jgi:hypothetical protein